jgi:hypothetical protein
MNTRRKQVIVLIGILVSAIFLWIAFRDLHPDDVLSSIGEANIAWLLIGAAWYFMAVSIITLRWQFLLRAIRFVPLARLIPLVCIGYMGNNVYPLRSGEALRIYLLKRNHDVPIVRATTTVLVERLFDGLVMLTFIVVPLLFVDVNSDEIRTVAYVAAPIFLTALAAFLGMAARPDWLRRFIRLIPGKLGAIAAGIGEEIIEGLEGLRSPTQLAGAVISSYATWAVEASVYWMASFAFDLHLGYEVMLLVVGTVNLAGLIPASPGQVGVFEFFASAVLVGVGVNELTATSYALTVHIVIWLPVTVAGFIFLVRQGLGWDAIAHARELEEKAATD